MNEFNAQEPLSHFEIFEQWAEKKIGRKLTDAETAASSAELRYLREQCHGTGRDARERPGLNQLNH